MLLACVFTWSEPVSPPALSGILPRLMAVMFPLRASGETLAMKVSPTQEPRKPAGSYCANKLSEAGHSLGTRRPKSRGFSPACTEEGPELSAQTTDQDLLPWAAATPANLQPGSRTGRNLFASAIITVTPKLPENSDFQQVRHKTLTCST